MAPPRTIQPKRCAYAKCGRLYRPSTTKRALDPNGCCSRRCATAHQHVLNPKRVGVEAARRANVKRARQRIDQAVIDEYGPLTARDVTLFALGQRIGYKRGYNAGYHDSRRKAVA